MSSRDYAIVSSTETLNDVKCHDVKAESNADTVRVHQEDSFAVFRRAASFSSPDFVSLGLGAAALFVNSGTNLYFPHAIGKIVDAASAGGGLMSSDLRGPGIFFISGAIASFVRVYSFGLAKEYCARRLKMALLNNFFGQDVNFFDEVGTGELLTTLDKDVATAADIFADKIPSALRSFNSAVLGSIFLFRVSPYLCAVSLSTIPVVGIVAVGLGKMSLTLTRCLRDLEKEQGVFVSERLRNISTVYLNGTQSVEREVFDRYGKSIFAQSKRKYFINGIKMSFISIATNASIIAVLFTGSRMVDRKEITQGDLTAFLMRSGFVGLGFSSMSSSFSDLRVSLASAAKVFSYVDAKNHHISKSGNVVHCDNCSVPHIDLCGGDNVDDRMSMSTYVDLSLSPSSSGLPDALPKLHIVHSDPASFPSPLISLRDIVFTYPSRPKPNCLNKLSMDIFDNSLTAIVGSSGSGKSSILTLLCALYSPVSGDIWVDGYHLSSCSDNDVLRLRDRNSTLFSGTVAYNIGYGVRNATRQDIEDAARQAFAHEFIMELPNGYDTEVGECGSQLSGGQRQRLAVCRALLRETDIMLLDEPSSSLDCQNEDLLIKLLTSLKKTKCIVVVTHSTSVMAAADEMHLLEDGVVVQSGKFATLKNTDRFKFMLKATNLRQSD